MLLFKHERRIHKFFFVFVEIFQSYKINNIGQFHSYAHSTLNYMLAFDSLLFCVYEFSIFFFSFILVYYFKY